MFKFKSIKSKILGASLLIVILPLLFTTIIVSSFLSSRAEKDHIRRIDAELAQINESISIFIDNIGMNLNMLCNHPMLKNIDAYSLNTYMDREGVNDLKKINRSAIEKNIYRQLKYIENTHPDYLELFIGTRYGGFVTSGEYNLISGYDPRSRPWYKDGESFLGKTAIAKSYLSVTGNFVTAVVKSFYDNKGDLLFVAGIDISLERLTNIINSIRIGESGYLVLIENDGRIIAHPKKPELNLRNIKDLGIIEFLDFEKKINTPIKYHYDGVDKIAKFYNSPDQQWKIVAVINSDELYKSASFFRNIMILTSVIIILLCSALYLYIHRRIIIPIGQLTEFGTGIAKGNFSRNLILNRDDELGRLSGDFNNLMLQIKENITSIKAIIEFMPSIIIQLDTDGRILEWNKMAEKLTGLSIDEAKNKFLKDIKPELSAYLWNIDKLIETEKTLSLYRIKLAEYDDKLFNIFIFLLKTETRKTIVLRIDDISELEKKDEQIRQSQKLESIGLLAGGIAHDFNNILGGIIGTISLLRYRIAKGKVENSSELDKDLALVENSCENGAGIVSQLLSLSRKEIDLELHKLDINEVMMNVSNICMKSFDKSITFTLKESPIRAYAMINGPQIQQSLLNLCINASHSMTIMRKENDPQGGNLEIGIVKIFADRFFLDSHPESSEGEYWRLYVRDTGIGMDSSTISKIYDPFFTTKTKTSVKGTGLGLSVVYSVIKAHRGFIDVYSEVGIGTIFSLYIPVSKSDDISDEIVIPEVCTGEGTVLIIDDDDVIRNYTSAMLEECGYNVVAAENGTKGLSLYSEKKSEIHAVMLDMVMPGKSGHETLVELKQINPHLPVLMTSGLYSNDLIESVKKAGAKDFIEKPYSIIQLSKKIRELFKD